MATITIEIPDRALDITMAELTRDPEMSNLQLGWLVISSNVLLTEAIGDALRDAVIPLMR